MTFETTSLVNSHIYHMGYPDILTQRIGQAAFGLTSSAVITLAVCKHTKRQGRQVDANRDRR